MSIKAKIEAIIYAAEEPITREQVLALVANEARRHLTQQQGESMVEDVPSAPPCPANSTEEPATTGTEPSEIPAEAESSSSEAGAITLPEHVEEPAGESSPTQSVAPAPSHAISDAEVKSAVLAVLEELIADYNHPDHGIEIRQIAGGYRMATKPEQHEVVRVYAKSLKPPIRLSLPALETLAVIAYKQPITAPEISDIRGVDSGGVLGTLLDRKLITTSGRKQVIGRPILYKTTKDFLLRFGLKDLEELPSMEEFEKLAAESLGADLFAAAAPEPAGTPAVAPETPEALPPTDEPATEAMSQSEAQPTDTSSSEEQTGNDVRNSEVGS
jgi:segregation and condensation protein B